MMAIETFLFSSPVNEKREQDRCDRPISNRPIEQGSSFQEEPCGEFPDFLHGTPPGKAFACELRDDHDDNQPRTCAQAFGR